MKKLAIIGTGISGMSAAYFLKNHFDLSIFEKKTYIGGHTHTISTSKWGEKVDFDTGFMVFNYKTYPLLTKLFKKLNVPIKKTDMSFSVNHQKTNFEFCGSGINGIFSQRKNILSLKHYKFILEINRFNRQCKKVLRHEKYQYDSIAEFAQKHKFSDYFLENYLIPMSSAVWSTPPEKMLNFPIVTLVRFFDNHGFLGLNTQFQWYTVDGGSQKYVEKIIDDFKDKVELKTSIEKVEKLSSGKVKIYFKGKSARIFDKVIFACHADQSLKLLSNPSLDQSRVLSYFKYQTNDIVVHSDSSVMPRYKRTWSSWNFRYDEVHGKIKPSTIYYMNKLQGISQKNNYFVSVNPQTKIDPDKIILKLQYDHPLFDVKSIQNQPRLIELNKDGPIYFCGSYFRYGFHEDGLFSSYNLCSSLLNQDDIL